MDKFSFFNDSFSISKISTYLLALQLQEKSYSYVIADSVTGRFVAVKYEPFVEPLSMKSLAEKIASMLKNDAFLNKNFKSVHFGIVTQKSTLVPKELFDKEHLRTFFEFNQNLSDVEELHFNYLKNTEVYNIFAIPSDVTTLLVNRFPEIQFYHHGSPFIENALEAARALKMKLPSIHVNVNDNFIDIVGISGEKMVLYNNEKYTTTEDILYHLLNVAKQLEMKLSRCYLFVSGDVDENEKTGKTLKRYFPNLRYAKEMTHTEFNFDELPEHKVVNLLNLHKCE